MERIGLIRDEIERYLREYEIRRRRRRMRRRRINLRINLSDNKENIPPVSDNLPSYYENHDRVYITEI